MLWVKMMEKCTGSTPSGRQRRARGSAAPAAASAMTSRKQPSTSSSTLMVSRNCQVRHVARQHPFDQLGRYARVRHPVPEGQRGGDDQHDGAGALQRIGDHRQGLRPVEAAVEDQADQQRDDGRDRRGLGDRDDAAVDADQDDRRAPPAPAVARTVTRSAQPSGRAGSTGKLRRRASYQTQAKKAAACSRPGRMPARNSRGTDCSATMP